MNELAAELNKALSGTVAGDSLSAFGRRMFFPKGIIAQSAEAKKSANRIDATIGIATNGGVPLSLSSIRSRLSALPPGAVFPYAPTAGIPALREAWKRETLKKNPSLSGKEFSLPVVATGLTHAIAIVLELFVDPGDAVIVPDLYWDNYDLIAEDRLGAEVLRFPLFEARGRFNADGFAERLRERRGGKAVVLLNFPNNPTGYALRSEEAALVVDIIKREAEAGTRIVAICDDAYFGLFYETGLKTESLFADLADLHSNVLAVKADAATKEELVWGFRVGFLSSGSLGLQPEHYDALIKKTMGSIRSSISCSGTPTQQLVLAALEDAGRTDEKEAIRAILEARYRRVRELVARMTGPLSPLPFNSGYFMTFSVPDGNAEKLRLTLLSRGIGTIAIRPDCLRVAYSSVDIERLEELFAALDEASRIL